jgi:hypothetical protein
MEETLTKDVVFVVDKSTGILYNKKIQNLEELRCDLGITTRNQFTA